MNGVIFERDFNRYFTEVVNSYMAKGLIFHPNSMRGSQGEIAKVDLTDGKDVYRIRLESQYADGDDFMRVDSIAIIVEKHEDAYNEDLRGYDTIWNGKGVEIYKKQWYELGSDGYKKVYTESLDEAIASFKKHLDRYKIRKGYKSVTIIPNEQMKERLKEMCKTHKGYGKMKADNINLIEKKMYENGMSYTVSFLDGKESLTLKRFVKDMNEMI